MLIESYGWGKAKALDGQRTTEVNSAGWSSDDNLVENHTEWVTIDLGASNIVNEVDLYPRSDGEYSGQGFPVDFTIKVSSDNTNWTTVVTQAGYSLPSATVQAFIFNDMNARYIKIEGTNLRSNPYDNNHYRMQLTEIEVCGRPNLALNKTITASSSFESYGWGKAKAVDGQGTTDANSAGWSSDNNLAENHAEWVTVDLGAIDTVNEVDLYPRSDGGYSGQGFPIDFTVKVSTDNVNWTTVVTQTDYSMPGATVQGFIFNDMNARYIKIEGTNLRTNPYDNNHYRMQLAEIGIY